MTERSGRAITPPLKQPIGVVISSGLSSMRRPRAGRLLIMVKMIPRAWSFVTADWARGVNRLSSVTNVPSTSETTAEMFGGENRGDVMKMFRSRSR
jgi:hypothetical protein